MVTSINNRSRRTDLDRNTVDAVRQNLPKRNGFITRGITDIRAHTDVRTLASKRLFSAVNEAGYLGIKDLVSICVKGQQK